MKDWYGRKLKIGDYVMYGHPNARFSKSLCKIVDVCSKRGLNVWELEYGDYVFTFPHNVVKVRENELVVLKLQGKI